MPKRNDFQSEDEWLEHLRIYFAAKAMQAYLSTYPEGGCDCTEEVAADSYIIADAMLAARKAGG